MRRKFSKFGKRLASPSGKINFVTIFIVLIIAAAIYFAVMLIPPYVEYYKFEEKIRAVANNARRVKNNEALLKDLHKESKILELNLPYDAITIQRDPMGKWIEISVSYARVVKLVPFEKSITLHFDSNVVENF
ncbi:MAG: hypothetical protein JRJ87_23160 [Deltaproteobacteria bacterium]|nr:hypothetical protein [Deltaproteobacteria bacterium]